MNYCINRTKAALAEVQTSLHWKFTMISPPSAVGMMSENAHIRMQSTSAPNAQEGNNPVDLQGHRINYVGKTTKAGQIQLTFVEDIDADLTTYMYKYSNARWSGTGTDTCGVQHYTKELKCDIQLDLMDPADKITQTYKLVGCLLTFNNAVQFNQEASTISPTVTVDYDDFHVFSRQGFKW